MTDEAPTLRFLIDADHAGRRLDVFLTAQHEPPLTRSQVAQSIERGEALVNDQAARKAGHKLRLGDRISWRPSSPPQPNLEPQDIPLRLLHDDDALAVVDKPAGLVVHPAPGHADGTLVNALLFHFAQLAGERDTFRPGIVHRLDKDTSGALVVAKTDAALRHLAALFHDHDIRRCYHALVFAPSLEPAGTFDTLHGRASSDRRRFTTRLARGRRAVTHYEILERFHDHVALVACTLETGRTHQIRVHLSEAGAPLLGDALYGDRNTRATPLIARQALHARTLGFTHPDGHPVDVTAPYPEDFAQALDALRQGRRWR